MSLINQMLRDLQQQKKGGGKTQPASIRPKQAARVPYLPLPLIMGGAALALLCLVWWLAGALSNMMFGYEPAAKPVAPQEIVASGEPDQLTLAEREAEPQVAPVVDPPPVAAEAQPVSPTLADKTLAVEPVAVKPAAVVAKPSASSVASRKPVAASPRVTQMPRPVQSRPTQTPTKVVVPPKKRLHPDDLPGAILSSSHNLVQPKKIDKSSRPHATTPYGMAEEAYLDGKWAFENKRDGLAVRSLQEALLLYPGHLQARELLVEIFSEQGKAGEAMFLLAEGLEIAPDYIVFKKRYSRLLMDQGDYDAATKVMLNGGLPTVEDDPEAHVVLASLYQHLGEPFLAAQTYRNLLVAWPQTGAFWVGLGGALEGQNLSKEAVVCYQRALKTKGLRQDLSLYAEKRLSVLN